MKKGGISLSVSAIVILILALVILGLLIGFIRGNFTKTAGQFEEQASPKAASLIPPVNDPLLISKEVVIAEPGSTFRIDVGARNPTNKDWLDARPVITCT